MKARLSALPDPRERRGKRHSLTPVLLTAACAVLAGARSCLAIGQRTGHAPQVATLEAVHTWSSTQPCAADPSSKCTAGQLLQRPRRQTAP
ncbi:transposase family protein [Streptomyces vinaceus]|uniref:transposase family protein n=1 Tax=Streptomyces vinaceus TaxID=1960 RepID=UPI0035DEA7F3